MITLPYLSVPDRPYILRREYRTEIIESRDGHEQRRSLRHTPLRRAEFSTTLRDEKFTDFTRRMVQGLRDEYFLHEQPRYTTLSEDLTGVIMEVESIPTWLGVDTYVTLIDDDRMETFQIASFDGGQIFLTSAVSETWPAGAKVHPAIRGYLSADTLTAVRWGTLLDPEIVFDSSPGRNALEPVGEAEQEFEGREVWLREPNFFNPVQITHSEMRESVYYGQGRGTPFHPQDFAARIYQANYTELGQENADLIRAFFDRMKGRRGEFWMPTWENDLPPAEESTDTLTVSGTGPMVFEDHEAYAAVAAFHPNGNTYFNRVVSLAEVSGDTVLTLDEAWPVTIPTDATVSWMPVWRFASDILETEWVMDQLAKTQISFRMLHDDPVFGGFGTGSGT